MTDEFNDLQDTLEELGREADALDGEEVPLLDLFDRSFMTNHTEFDTIEGFFTASPIDLDDESDVLESEDFKHFVEKNTLFPNFDEMLEEAGREWIATRLSFL